MWTFKLHSSKIMVIIIIILLDSFQSIIFINGNNGNSQFSTLNIDIYNELWSKPNYWSDDLSEQR